MLLELDIKDFALIKHICVPFSNGLNVLTGETGAGKSIIIDALNIVLGGKTNPQIIHPHSEKSVIEATFTTSPAISAWLKKNELQNHDSDSFTISREIGRNGSKIRINGTLVSIPLIMDLKQSLITFHAQHEARSLLSSQAQLDMLDALGDNEHKKLLAKFHTLYARYKELSAQQQEIQATQTDKERQLDFAKFQFLELSAALLNDPREDEIIADKRRKLANINDLERMVANVQLYLRGQSDTEYGALELLQKSASELEKACQLDNKLENIRESLVECVEQLSEHCRALRHYNDTLDSDPTTLATIEERSALLAGIKRKYGPTLADAITKQEALTNEIDRLENSQTYLKNIDQELSALKTEIFDTANKLSNKRKSLSTKLTKRIIDELTELGMPNCQFEIAISKTVLNISEQTQSLSGIEDNYQLSSSGINKVEMLISPNPGQPLFPLAKIASGGELSRIMLAIKTIFAEADHVNTVVFDEIDTGLSGKTLQSMRNKLAALARVHQILCITHQPLIASIADNHIFVSKEQSNNHTSINIHILNEPERVTTLANMASGDKNKQVSLEFARSLYNDAQQVKDRLTSSS